MKRSTSNRMLLSARMAIIGIGIGFGFFQFVLIKVNQSSDLDQSITEVSEEMNRSLEELKSGRPILEVQAPQYRDWEEEVLSGVPSEPHVNEYLGQVNQEAARREIKVLSSYAELEIEIESDRRADSPAVYYRIPMSFELAGDWVNLAEFLQQLKSHPRRVRFNSVSFQRKEEFFPLCHAKVHLEVYYYREASEATSPAKSRKR